MWRGFCFLIAILFFSCASAEFDAREDRTVAQDKTAAESDAVVSPYPAKITMLFAGDIMAHSNNYRTGNFEKIWADIAPLAQSADLAFANIEAPVNDGDDWSSYPEFNMKSEYPNVAIDAGFNVFSLANNHTNDKRADGIEATLKWASDTALESSYGDRQVYFSGAHAKDESETDYTIIEKGEWRILFVAMTEILNRYAETEYINYVRVTEDARKSFAEKVSELKKSNNCNFCVVSVHCNEPEYVRTVSQNRKNFYYRLLDAGADVVWANHPHVIQEHELVGAESERGQSAASASEAPASSEAPTAGASPLRKLIMYANGNTISGQRRAPNFSDAADYWEWTGDGVLTEVTFEIEAAGQQPRITQIAPYYITSYINTANQIIIKKLDDNFVDYLINEAERPSWAKYAAERKKLVEATKEITTWR